MPTSARRQALLRPQAKTGAASRKPASELRAAQERAVTQLVLRTANYTLTMLPA